LLVNVPVPTDRDKPQISVQDPFHFSATPETSAVSVHLVHFVASKRRVPSVIDNPRAIQLFESVDVTLLSCALNADND
jgi:hypothetical protein